MKSEPRRVKRRRGPVKSGPRRVKRRRGPVKNRRALPKTRRRPVCTYRTNLPAAGEMLTTLGDKPTRVAENVRPVTEKVRDHPRRVPEPPVCSTGAALSQRHMPRRSEEAPC